MKKRGFTFIELLVAVTIIAVLMAVGIVSYTNVNKRARDAKRKADIESIRSALEICRSAYGRYPATADVGANITCTGTTDVVMTGVPSTPKGNTYTYTYVSNTQYTLTCGGDNFEAPVATCSYSQP